MYCALTFTYLFIVSYLLIDEMHMLFIQVLNFNDVKWDEKPFTGVYGVRLTDHDSAFVISTNVISMDDVICFGLRWNYGEHRTPNECYSVAFLQVKNIELSKLNLQPTLTDFALTTCKGAFHIVGGAFVSKYNNSYYRTGKESNLILSCVGHTKLESNYPPMKTASASPAVVTYKERIVVVHGKGSRGEIEVLDTNSVNPVWVQLRARFPSWGTPSATIVGSTLVVWVGGLYCMSLEYVTASPQHQLPPGIYPIAAPPNNMTGNPLNGCLLTLRGQLVAIGRPQVEGCGMRIYAYRSATREWVNIDNRKQFDMALTTSATSLTVFQLPNVYPSSCMGYIGSV